MKSKLDNALQIYDEYLKNSTITFKIENGEIIKCTFLKKNFQHLTGVKYEKNISASQFYDNLKKGKLSDRRLIYDDHARMKLEVFPHLQFQVGQTIELHKNGEYINVSFLNDKVISRNSAILCIDDNYPKSLLKKNMQIQGENVRGMVYSIEDITNNNKQQKHVEKNAINRSHSILSEKKKPKRK